MVSSSPQKLKFACPSCGAKYEVPESMAGKRGPCAKCGAEVQAPAATRKKTLATPQYVPIECRVCQTRFYGTPDQIGNELKCPDCGARNVLQPPPEVRPKKAPAALDGEQYELWDVGEQPLPSDLAAAQPTYIAVHCIHCHTLMHAGLDQVGQEIRCPDCGKTREVPPAPDAPRSVLRDDAPELDIDPTADPGPPPPVILPPVRRMLYEEEEDAERERRAAKQDSKTKKRAAEVDVEGRPVLPEWPLVNGILPFLFYTGTPACWLALSLGLAPLLFLGLDGLSGWLGLAVSGQALFVGTMELILAGFFGLIWSAYSASVILAVAAETAYGSEQIEGWPSANFIESMPELGYVMVTVSVSSAPGWLLGFTLFPEPWSVAALGLASLWLFFPIVLLSQMAGASAIALVNARVLASLARCPFSWLLFYIETAALAAVCVASVAIGLLLHYLTIALFAPLYVACLLLYARLVGRLGWRIAEAMPVVEKPSA